MGAERGQRGGRTGQIGGREGAIIGPPPGAAEVHLQCRGKRCIDRRLLLKALLAVLRRRSSSFRNLELNVEEPVAVKSK